MLILGALSHWTKRRFNAFWVAFSRFAHGQEELLPASTRTRKRAGGAG